MEQIITFNYNAYRNKAGIYRIINKVNNKSYIGQSINVGRRLYAHLLCMRKNTENQVIYKAVRKHGIENFYVEILTILPQHEQLKKNLDECEKIYIQFYDSYENGYNSTLGGDGGILGYRMPEEEKRKRSLAQKGKKKDRMKINHKAKTVYLYNMRTEMYIIASSALDAVDILVACGVKIDPKHIQGCAKGRNKTTSGFICAYNLEELKEKITLYNGNKDKETF